MSKNRIIIFGVKEIQFTRELDPSDLPNEPYNLDEICNVTIQITDIDAATLLHLLGFQSPLERLGAAQCVALAEQIAFGAWAVRCAEQIVRGA